MLGHKYTMKGYRRERSTHCDTMFVYTSNQISFLLYFLHVVTDQLALVKHHWYHVSWVANLKIRTLLPLKIFTGNCIALEAKYISWTY